MGSEPEIPCPACGAAHYPDGRTWTKCDCGERVYFEDWARKKFGSPVPPKFRNESSSTTDEEDGEDDDRDASLFDFDD